MLEQSHNTSITSLTIAAVLQHLHHTTATEPKTAQKVPRIDSNLALKVVIKQDFN